MKHLYMFVIDVGMAGLRKYDFGETFVINTKISIFIYNKFSYSYCLQSLLGTNDSIP